ncbi:NAD(P)/FAD-dependent oxidoreductase [Rhodobacteraceae bacterium NNCM2]|nr:NAD(P)/FAD-dependent oxidoreductase [Coraliihabitans acroporae]
MTERESVETVVIGAGVVGLAAARALAKSGREVIVIEGESLIGSITSARNSEVIHAGIYYPTGSLKAQLCVRGREMLYRYCDERAIAHRRCGKLIVATSPDQHPAFQQIADRARANGVGDLKIISRGEALAMEPALHCTAAIHSPSTGIIDSHGLMVSLLGEAENHGAMLALNTPVTRLGREGDGFLVETGGEAPMALNAREVVLAAGHGSVPLAHGLLADSEVPGAWFARGCYFKLTRTAPFSHLIYPAPEPGGLGVHLTLDLSGQARFGPDVEWIESEDYTLDPARGEKFYAAIRHYWPDLPDGALLPDYTGIRPKITGPGSPAADFSIGRPLPGLVTLFGIESPGLTSCLAIAEHVEELLDRV